MGAPSVASASRASQRVRHSYDAQDRAQRSHASDTQRVYRVVWEERRAPTAPALHAALARAKKPDERRDPANFDFGELGVPR
jgi:hypothetical protein